MEKPAIGLLPLYLELYDRAVPQAREKVENFLATIAAELDKRGLRVITAPVCRLEKEFQGAIADIEEAGVDALVTLHLAYSPSLESISALAGTPLPIIVLDTTPSPSFGPDSDPGQILMNHGIHGVQDMCNMLIRAGKPFEIEAGHWRDSDVIDRVANWVRAARMVSSIRSARVGIIGRPFEGMGDFSVPFDTLAEKIGITTIEAEPDQLAALMPEADAPEVAQEMESDRERFDCSNLPEDVHVRSARTSLAVRRWIEKEKLTAFTFNFLNITADCGLAAVPFVEAGKAMSRGIGYAGEGDVLTAAFVGALAQSHPETTFSEMFCPDWNGGAIFMSHMGEMNPDLASGKPSLIEKDFPYTDAENPAAFAGRLKPGHAILADLAPGPDNTYTLIVSPVEALGPEEDNFQDSVRGWIRPMMPVAEFLAEYSSFGGTHHLALVYGDVCDDIIKFGKLMGWRVAGIRE